MAEKYVMYTSNPIQKYEFSWAIQNFSFSPDVLRGPIVSPIPGHLENICLELQYKCSKNIYHMFTMYLEVCLIDLNAKLSQVVISAYTTIRDTNDRIIFEGRKSNCKLEKCVKLASYNGDLKHYFHDNFSLIKQMKLVDDILVVKCELTISGYDTASSVSLPKHGSTACEELLTDLKSVYQSGASSDITFNIGGKTLQAHKFILRVRSPVFAKMFDTDMLESKSNVVVINDAGFESFNCFLMFLYTGDVEDNTWDTVLSLYSLAHKYQVKSLHEVCFGILGNGLTIESVCSVLVLGDLHGDQVLKDVAKNFIRYNLEVVGMAEWNEIILPKPHLLKELINPI